MRGVVVGGDVADGFGPVADEFARNFAGRGEVGAAVAVWRDGRPVVDLWGGLRDTARGLPWRSDTMVPVFSTTKGVAALVLAALRSRGVLDYDARVADYWPEFAQHGKDQVTVRQLLAHEAGLAVLDVVLRLPDLADLDALATVLARQRPAWPPGSGHGYHAITLGLYQNEIVRRVDAQHRTIGTVLAEDFAKPLGLEFYIGLPDDVDFDRVAVLGRIDRRAALGQLRGAPVGLAVRLADKRSLVARSLSNPRLGAAERFTRRKVLAPEVASSNGVGEVRALAALYGLAAVGAADLPVDENVLEELARPFRGRATPDLLLRARRAFQLGFTKPIAEFRFGSPGGRSYGTPGLGGSFAFADPDARVGFAYAPNRLGIRLDGDPREVALRRAVYRCLG